MDTRLADADASVRPVPKSGLSDMLLPRSILFVPANKAALVSKACRLPADVICLDLEDSVALGDKAAARAALSSSTETLSAAEKTVWVRINSEFECLSHDLDALPAKCSAVVLPKAQDMLHVNMLGDSLERCWQGRRATVPPGIVAMLESSAAVQRFARDDRCQSHAGLQGLSLGTEDLSAELGCEPSASVISFAFSQLSLTSARLGVPLYGFPGSISDYRQLSVFESSVERGRSAGASGAFCIHPDQIAVINRVFTPSDSTLSWAKSVVDAFEQNGNSGVTSIGGKMIDPPVYQRALRVLSGQRS